MLKLILRLDKIVDINTIKQGKLRHARLSEKSNYPSVILKGNTPFKYIARNGRVFNWNYELNPLTKNTIVSNKLNMVLESNGMV